jgi:Domain of unknown function (DUF5667)
VKKLKKLTSNKKLNKIAKSALALVLAGSFTFSATNAFADSNIELQTNEIQAETNTNETVLEASKTQEAPSLLPGDFFYFAKLAFEKMQLALTYDDVKEAKLLASFASERLAEAESLFAKGEEEAALEVIKAGMENMNSANKVVDKEEQQDLEQPSDKVIENEQSIEDNDSTENEQTSDEAVVDDEVSDKDQAAESENGVEEVKEVLSQNMIALTAAMEKVKNPVAKAALQKNMDKSYKKLAKKINKWEQKLAKKQEKAAKKKSEAEQTTVENETSSEVTSKVVSADSEDKIKITKGKLADHKEQNGHKAGHQESKHNQVKASQHKKEVNNK